MMSRCKSAILALCIVSPALQPCARAFGDSTSPISTSQQRKAMEAGVYNLTYRSKVDGSLQPLLVKVPQGYCPQQTWPLLVTLHGFGDGPILAPGIDRMLQIGPSGRGSVQFTGIGEADVFECIDVAGRLFAIDEDRVYLCGFSMGAAATFNLGLRYPHRWAACVPVCGPCPDPNLIVNAGCLPFWIHAGRKDIVVPARRVRAAYEQAAKLGLAHWRYTEHDDLGHNFSINWPDVEAWLAQQRRVSHPRQITFCVSGLRSNLAYWLEVVAVNEYGKPARADAAIEGQTVTIRAENVCGYTLHLSESLLDVTRQVRVIEDDREVFCGVLPEGGRFQRLCAGGGIAGKRPGLSGPLWDVYSAPCLLVYGTNGPRSHVAAAKKCAEAFAEPGWMSRMAFDIVVDQDVKRQDIVGKNLVLFGNPELNTLLAELAPRLPVGLHGNRVTACGETYSAAHIGYVLLWPNPLDSQRYVAVFAGNGAGTIDCFHRIWPQFDSVPRDIDFGVFEARSDGSIIWLHKGVFGARWNCPSGL